MTRIVPLLALALLTGCASAAQDPATDASATPAASDAASPAPKPAPSQEPAPMPSTTPDAARTLHLRVGESASLADGSRLTYQQLVNDSRCAPDVQCVWAGDAEILVQWQPASGPAQTASLHTSTLQGRKSEATFGPYRVHLDSLERGTAPKATLSVRSG